ncbi:TniQ family protein [Paenibacillus sp. Soil724D2]|uniref:TniQ family protein n=1 Tax=Paenibacillus sp. (strain Soil724D2) TaxID=1736392 RepID=UPI00071437C6|nr:TniQ family protein [Paenibacillus sp. Soil724D2]KRE48439.1 hypothetical protein ASG85_05400 [Paenibacillus sp. Soil724D2]
MIKYSQKINEKNVSIESLNFLPKRPFPFSDESLGSYIVRLADANGYTSSKLLCKEAGLITGFSKSTVIIRLNMIDTTKWNLKKLSIIGKVSEIQLLKLTFNTFTREIPEYALHNKKRKICPECLNEPKVYGRKVWEINLVTICTRHKCLLVDACPNCSGLLHWDNISKKHCNCGYDLSQIKPLIVAKNEIQLSNYIELYSNKYLISKEEEPSLHNHFFDFLNVIIFLIGQIFTQSQSETDNRSWSGSIFRSMRNQELHLLIKLVLSLLKNWPSNFLDFLQKFNLEKMDAMLLRKRKNAITICFFPFDYNEFCEDGFIFSLDKLKIFIMARTEIIQDYFNRPQR